MTVKELATELKKLPPSAEITIVQARVCDNDNAVDALRHDEPVKMAGRIVRVDFYPQRRDGEHVLAARVTLRTIPNFGLETCINPQCYERASAPS